MRIVILTILLVLINNPAKSQKASPFDFFAGYGFYEGFNLGSEYGFRADRQSISLSVGYDRLMRQENIALLLGYNIAVFRKRKNSFDQYKWHIYNKAVLWQLNDDYYLWRAVSVIPSLGRKFALGQKLGVSFDTGLAVNFVLYNKRKTFREVGWPYHVMPDFRLCFIF
jgi:lipopolysaccharide assembly outer membrane protein LptD (OstA)